MPGGKDGLNCEGEGEGAELGGEVRCGGKSIFFHFASGDTNKMGANSPPGDASTAARRCWLRRPPCRRRRCCHHPSLSRLASPPPRPQPAPSFLQTPLSESSTRPCPLPTQAQQISVLHRHKEPILLLFFLSSFRACFFSGQVAESVGERPVNGRMPAVPLTAIIHHQRPSCQLPNKTPERPGGEDVA